MTGCIFTTVERRIIALTRHANELLAGVKMRSLQNFGG
jgi:hypothetical protein